mgnify:CR=1 FL=1
MAIAFANLGASANPDINNSTDASSYVNTSWTPPTSGLILVGVGTRVVAGPNIPTISGNGITWVQIATILFTASTTNDERITLFGADASGSSAGATSVAFAGQTQLSCTVSFLQATGVDLSGGVAAAFVQKPTGSDIAATSGSIALAAAADAANRPIALWFHFANEVTTPRTNWTEADDLRGSGPLRGVETQYRSDAFETTASASWVTSSRWGVIAAELKAEVAAAVAPVLRGSRHPMHMWRDLPRRRLSAFHATPVFGGPADVGLTLTGDALLDSTPSLESAGQLPILGDALLDSTPSLETAGALEQRLLGDALLDSTPSLETAGALEQRLLGDALLDSTPSLESAGQLPILGDALLDSTPSLEAAGSLTLLLNGDVLLDSTPTLETAGTVELVTGVTEPRLPIRPMQMWRDLPRRRLGVIPKEISFGGPQPQVSTLTGNTLLDSTPSLEAAGQLPLLGDALLDSTPSLEAAGSINHGLLTGNTILDSTPSLEAAGQLPLLGNAILDSTPEASPGPISGWIGTPSSFLTDDFNDNSVGAQWTTFVVGSASVTETGQQAKVALAANQVNEGGYESVEVFQLLNSYIFVHLSDLGSLLTPGAGYEAGLYIDDTADRWRFYFASPTDTSHLFRIRVDAWAGTDWFNHLTENVTSGTPFALRMAGEFPDITANIRFSYKKTNSPDWVHFLWASSEFEQNKIRFFARSSTSSALSTSIRFEGFNQDSVLGTTLLDSTPTLEAAGSIPFISGDERLDATPLLEQAGSLGVISGNAILDATPTLESAGQLPLLGNTLLDSTPSLESAGQLPILGDALLDSTPTLESTGEAKFRKAYIYSRYILDLIGHPQVVPQGSISTEPFSRLTGDYMLTGSPFIENGTISPTALLIIQGNGKLDFPGSPSIPRNGEIEADLFFP